MNMYFSLLLYEGDIYVQIGKAELRNKQDEKMPLI